ncbi:ankyrin repeat domain-containing protein [Pseudovibrio sp. FO-BEG1]|uniref:ankyrin repeat domain-containing protein n=1 Tax=Pseudovibrio sp. (strain FO-BEG1) TaxID=911045 RepID=UPI0013052E92|nr:ankyrin repeat domain-containing protein [Pseudovibrio sp. FO-BEG1]
MSALAMFTVLKLASAENPSPNAPRVYTVQVSPGIKVVTRITPNGCVASFWAFSAFSPEGRAKKAEKHIRSEIKPSQINSELMAAVVRNQIEEVERLLVAGSAVNETNAAGCTALQWAISFGHYDIFKLLLAYGADVNQPDAAGRTPMMIAGRKRSVAMVQELISRGVDVNVGQSGGVNEKRTTALHYAAGHEENSKVIGILIKAGAKVNATEERGKTPLFFAAQTGSLDNVRTLIEAGADRLVTDQQGKTAYDAAKRFGRSEVAEWLLSQRSAY